MIIKPKKSLGQNFLIDKNILKKISNTVEINSSTEILEIGPGTGNLTEFLVKKNPKSISVIEKDKSLSNFLKEKFNNNIYIYNEDVLNFTAKKLNGKKLIIFGNLPYNISSQILVKFIINKENFNYENIIFMFQKELADRILSNENSKDYGRISILSKWKFDIRKIFDINPSSFNPRPKIRSTLLLFTPKKNLFEFKKIENLEYVTRIFFNQRRKKIKKPLNILFKNNMDDIRKLNLDLNLRPQNISINTFFQITREYEKLT